MLITARVPNLVNIILADPAREQAVRHVGSEEHIRSRPEAGIWRLGYPTLVRHHQEDKPEVASPMLAASTEPVGWSARRVGDGVMSLIVSSESLCRRQLVVGQFLAGTMSYRAKPCSCLLPFSA